METQVDGDQDRAFGESLWVNGRCIQISSHSMRRLYRLSTRGGGIALPVITSAPTNPFYRFSGRVRGDMQGLVQQKDRRDTKTQHADNSSGLTISATGCMRLSGPIYRHERRRNDL